MALKSAPIVDFCGKSNGFADFENTVDGGSVVNFGPKRNLDHGSFFSLGRYVNVPSKLFLFLERSPFKFIVLCLVIKHFAFFGICGKLTMTFTFTSLPLSFCFRMWSSSGFGFELKYWRIDRFGEKIARIGGFAYPIHPPRLHNRCLLRQTTAHRATFNHSAPSEPTRLVRLLPCHPLPSQKSH